MKSFSGKQFIESTIEGVGTKTELVDTVRTRYILRAMIAGAIIVFGYAVYYQLIQFFTEFNFIIGQGQNQVNGSINLIYIGKVLASAFFPLCLVAIYFTKSELLTSNMMMLSVTKYYGKITTSKMIKIMTLCFLGNILGGLIFGGLMGMTSILDVSIDQINIGIIAKQNYIINGNWIDLLIRAIFCNIFINISMLMIYSGNLKDDYGKIIAMFFGVFIFAFLGLEHSVANMTLFVMGAMHSIFNGIPLVVNGVAAIIQIIVVLIGNFIGGGIFIGVLYAYLNDDRKLVSEGEEEIIIEKSIEGEENVNSK